MYALCSAYSPTYITNVTYLYFVLHKLAEDMEQVQ
jgi:hypothetical protein